MLKSIALIVCGVVVSAVVLVAAAPDNNSAGPVASAGVDLTEVNSKLDAQEKRIKFLEAENKKLKAKSPRASSASPDVSAQVKKIVNAMLEGKDLSTASSATAAVADTAALEHVSPEVLEQIKSSVGRDVVKNWRKYEAEERMASFKARVTEKLELSGDSEVAMNSILEEFTEARKNLRDRVTVADDASREDRRDAYRAAYKEVEDERDEKVKSLLGGDEDRFKVFEKAVGRGRDRGNDRGGRGGR
jgi:hypothetical protein